MNEKDQKDSLKYRDTYQENKRIIDDPFWQLLTSDQRSKGLLIRRTDDRRPKLIRRTDDGIGQVLIRRTDNVG